MIWLALFHLSYMYSILSPLLAFLATLLFYSDCFRDLQYMSLTHHNLPSINIVWFHNITAMQFNLPSYNPLCTIAMFFTGMCSKDRLDFCFKMLILYNFYRQRNKKKNFLYYLYKDQFWPSSFRAEFLNGTSFSLNDFLVIFLVNSDDDEFLAFAPLKTSYFAYNASKYFSGF